MTFSAEPLPYDHGALASKGISKEQVTFHYEKHHKGYAAKLNAAAEANPELKKQSLIEIIKTVKGPVFNSAAQLWNHNFYWKSLCPNGGGVPTGRIAAEINKSFGSFDKFKEEFTTAATGHFGSGWAWLVKDTNTNALKIYQTHDANTPLTEDHLKPILTCDVWEHAYYIDYRNDRPAYVNTWWNVVNWKFAEEQL
uniref:Superoxide dismutase n=1 Tax=Lygus hesperus TaxID=30085 RepID=A0A0A9W1T4_LYGHE